jgi:small subunit ribosomal protein S6
VRYEVLLLAVPEITADESSQLESQLREVIRENKGSCLSFERWGKFKLAYPVKKNEYGVYFLVRLEAENERIQGLLSQVEALLRLKYNEIVMRYLINKLDSKMSLAYQRPESLEDVPGKVADSLLREHRVEFDEGREARNETFTSEL